MGSKGARRGLVIDEVAVRVSFTLETSVLLCALGVDRAAFERSAFWESFSAFRGEIWVKPTEATGVAQEAHRGWPGGRIGFENNPPLTTGLPS